jgi:hypothetical protein
VAAVGEPEGFALALVRTEAPGLSCQILDTEVPMPERECAIGSEAADAALQAFGGLGYARRSGIVDLQRVPQFLRLAPVNAEGALSAVGEIELDLPRSSRAGTPRSNPSFAAA